MTAATHGSLLYSTRILLVEDEHFLRDLLIQALNSVGFSNVLEAENGSSALHLLERHEVDILISDIEMTQVNGFDLVRAVRMGDTRLPRDTPVVFLSGLSDVSTLSSAARLDVQGFLIKPVSAKRLLNKIRDALNEDIAVQPVPAYRSMSLRESRDDNVAPAPERPPTAGREPGPSRILSMDVLMLEPGMTLQSNVTARGLLLLKAGTRLAPIQIRVLVDMRELLDERTIAVELPDATE